MPAIPLHVAARCLRRCQLGQHHPEDAAIFTRFLEEELGWEEFLWDEAFAHPDGLDPGDVVYLRCAPGLTNPLYPTDPERPGARRRSTSSGTRR